MPIRICMVVPRYPPDRCGVGDYTYLLAQHLAHLDVSVDILTSRRPALSMTLQSDAREQAGVRVLALVDDWGWRSLLDICAVIRAGRYDVVHVQYQNEMYGRSASITALPLALRILHVHVSTIVTVHDYGTPWPRRIRVRFLAGPYGKGWFAVMLLISKRIILTNEQDEYRFLYQRWHYPVPAARYTAIPVGSNLPIPAIANDVNIPGDRIFVSEAPMQQQGSLTPIEVITVGYFGFVNPGKGVDTLLEGFALARHRNPHLRLVMICELHRAAPYHQQLRERISRADLRDFVTITGELDDIQAAEHLVHCDIVALPFRDGVSLRRTTLMAALTLSRPVISTIAIVPPQNVVAGRDLVLIPPGDTEALARVIVELADDPARRAMLGRRAREAARAFAWPTIAERTVALYRQVVAAAQLGKSSI